MVEVFYKFQECTFVKNHDSGHDRRGDGRHLESTVNPPGPTHKVCPIGSHDTGVGICGASGLELR